MVLMKNPQHGWMHAYSPAEVERLKLQGWSVCEPAASPEPEAEAEAEAEAKEYTASDKAPKRAYNKREK